MTHQELIDAIVKEVRRVLAGRGIEVDSVAAAPSAKPAVSVMQSADSVGSRDMTGKQIIAQKDIEGVTGKTLSVARTTVVTPLAADYARSKGITITRVDVAVCATAPEKMSAAPLVALAFAPDFTGDKSIVTGFLENRGVATRDTGGKDYAASVSSVCDAVSSGAAFVGVLIENTGMEGPILANRVANIRAVHCRNTFEARAARIDFGANVIVVDMASDPQSVIGGYLGL